MTSENKAVEEISSTCLAVRVRMINRAVTAIYDEVLQPFGLTTSQLNILVAVARMGRITPTALGSLLHMEKSTVSRNMDRLLAAGWIEADLSVSGRRQEYAATMTGLSLLEGLQEAWRGAQAQAQALLDQDGCSAIYRTASRIAHGKTPSSR